MAQFDGQNELIVWRPDLFPHDPEASAGKCRFAPNCGGVPNKDGSVTRPDHPGCPAAPAEFAERTGMERDDAGFYRYIALCRARADRRYGAAALAAAETEQL